MLHLVIPFSSTNVQWLVSSSRIETSTFAHPVIVSNRADHTYFKNRLVTLSPTGRIIRSAKKVGNQGGRSFTFCRSKGENVNLYASKTELNTPSSKKIRTNANLNAQKVFELICSRYNIENLRSPDWTKARRYIYHATSSSSTKKPLAIYQIESVLDFLDNCFETESSLNTIFVIQSIPRIFRKDPESYLKPTVKFLKDLYGAQMFHEFVKRRPEVLLTVGLGYNSKTLIDVEDSRLAGNFMKTDDELISVDDYLESQDLGISQHSLSIMKSKYPTVFQRSLTNVKECIEYILSCMASTSSTTNDGSPVHLRGNTESKSRMILGKMVKANPNILNLSVTNLRSKVEFFQVQCGFDSSEKIIVLWKKFPGILGLSLEKNLRPTKQLVHNLLIVDKSEHCDSRLYKVLSSHPQLLALSPQNLASKAAYFDNIDANSSSTLASRIAIYAPSVFSLSLKENIMPKIEALSNLWGVSYGTIVKGGNKSERSLSKRIAEYPNVLTLSLEGNIYPSISFYNRTGYITCQSTTDQIAGHNNSMITQNYLPARYLAASLYNRLLPRWNFHIVQEANRLNEKEISIVEGFDESKIGPGASPSALDRKPPLHILAGASDDAFCRRMKYDYDTYMDFKKEAVPRLKFSSQFDTWLKTGRPIDLDVGLKE